MASTTTLRELIQICENTIAVILSTDEMLSIQALRTRDRDILDDIMSTRTRLNRVLKEQQTLRSRYTRLQQAGASDDGAVISSHKNDQNDT